MSKTGKALLALAVAAATLVFVAWFDSSVMNDARIQAAAHFDNSGLTATWAVGSFAVAGAVLLVATLAWQARSALASLAYIVIGGFFALLPWVTWNFQPALPEPLADVVAYIWSRTLGPLNALGTVGAGMVIAGIATLSRSWRERGVAPSEANVPAATAERTLL